jgi:dephospho-CoA kinase
VRRARSASAGGSREARLIPDAEKAARADYVFENSGSLDDLDEFVAAVVADLT